MGIQSGKISVIYDDDSRLAAVWKGKPEETREREDARFGVGDGGGEDPKQADRPQRSDIVLKGFESYDDDLGVKKVKAKFRIYNSSTEKIDGFSFALTLSDQQGGRP
jgi:hypothetical protein